MGKAKSEEVARRLRILGGSGIVGLGISGVMAGVMAGKPERIDGGAIDEWPFEEPGELDGFVGFPLESDEVPPSQSSQVYVCAPDGPSASWAMGLEDDVRLLAQAFAAGGIDLCRELIEGIAPRSSGKSRSLRGKEEVQVALHGLEFDAGEEEELRDLIWMLVEKRIEGAGVRP